MRWEGGCLPALLRGWWGEGKTIFKWGGMSSGAVIGLLQEVVQWVKSLPAMQELQEIWVRSLGQEDPLEEGMAIQPSILT